MKSLNILITTMKHHQLSLELKSHFVENCPIISLISHCTCENVYQKKFVQSKWLLYFGKYGYGGHVDIKCKSFNVPLIRFQMKRQIEVQKCHIFYSKLLSKIFLVNIFAGTVFYLKI